MTDCAGFASGGLMGGGARPCRGKARPGSRFCAFHQRKRALYGKPDLPPIGEQEVGRDV